MTASRREIVELWQRAQEALQASGTLLAAALGHALDVRLVSVLEHWQSA
jgi:hypothetical protein